MHFFATVYGILPAASLSTNLISFSMRKICTLIFALVFCFAGPTAAQTKQIKAGGLELKISAADTSLNAAFCSVGIMPHFPGGSSKMVAFAKQHLHYPKSAIRDDIQGSVFLQFSINEKGKLVNKKVSRGVRYDLDTVCLKMLHRMPAWKPGRLNGKAIAVNLRWEIIFVLTD
jgi:TonB family protein